MGIDSLGVKGWDFCVALVWCTCTIVFGMFHEIDTTAPTAVGQCRQAMWRYSRPQWVGSQASLLYPYHFPRLWKCSCKWRCSVYKTALHYTEKNSCQWESFSDKRPWNTVSRTYIWPQHYEGSWEYGGT